MSYELCHAALIRDVLLCRNGKLESTFAPSWLSGLEMEELKSFVSLIAAMARLSVICQMPAIDAKAILKSPAGKERKKTRVATPSHSGQNALNKAMQDSSKC